MRERVRTRATAPCSTALECSLAPSRAALCPARALGLLVGTTLVVTLLTGRIDADSRIDSGPPIEMSELFSIEKRASANRDAAIATLAALRDLLDEREPAEVAVIRQRIRLWRWAEVADAKLDSISNSRRDADVATRALMTNEIPTVPADELSGELGPLALEAAVEIAFDARDVAACREFAGRLETSPAPPRVIARARAMLAVAERRFSDARNLLATNGDHAPSRALLAVVELEDGPPSRAATAASAALFLEPFDPVAIEANVRSKIRLGDPERALELARNAAARLPFEPDLRALPIEVALENGAFERARALIDENSDFWDQHPSHRALFLARIAWEFRIVGDLEAALASWQESYAPADRAAYVCRLAYERDDIVTFEEAYARATPSDELDSLRSILEGRRQKVTSRARFVLVLAGALGGLGVGALLWFTKRRARAA